ncbi:hypothetical protein EEL33_01295 [Muribaculaceae bacterium Isolate-037 (Harlan)]|nr:hypothetical protein EEL33_01295 [Muribaculaceae bacterium Isolate-037 (Harlan)]
MAKGYKTGGRQKGTPNKSNPIKGILINHSAEYFSKRLQTDAISGGAREIQRARLVQETDGTIRKVIDTVPLTDSNGFPLNLSDFEADMLALDPAERMSAELKILEFHTPRMKSQDINMEVNMGPRTIEDTLKALCGCGEEDEDE